MVQARVVPRAWTIYFAEMAGVEVPDELPEAWIEAAEREAPGPVPDRLSEPPPRGGGSAGTVVDRVIREVRGAVFTRHGLDPDMPPEEPVPGGGVR